MGLSCDNLLKALQEENSSCKMLLHNKEEASVEEVLKFCCSENSIQETEDKRNFEGEKSCL